MKTPLTLISLGIINSLHAGMHILQFIQSFLLVQASTFGPKIQHVNRGIIDTMIHSPYFAILWAAVGVFTIWIGIKDFIHHKSCKMM